MFTPREQLAGYGMHGGDVAAAALPARTLPASFRFSPASTWKRRWRAIETRCAGFEWAPDLAEDIGSTRWFRGFGTLVALVLAALAFWPSFAPLKAAPLVHGDVATAAEMRSVAIQPLAFGARSGRHWDANALAVPLASVPERSTLRLVATLGDGDSIDRMLQRAGVGGADAARVSALVGNAVALSSIAPGTHFDITLGRRDDPALPRPLEAMSFRARLDLDLAVDRSDGALALVRTPIEVDATPLRVRGIVGSSLYRSARAAGAPASAIQEYLQTLDQYMSLDDLAPSDEFDMIIGYKRAAGGEAEIGNLLYAGLDHDGKPREQLVRLGSSGAFYDALDDGSSDASRGYAEQLGMPVANGHITSGFGLRRHPILGYVRMHDGIDYGAPFGSPIYAVADGVVNYAGWRGGYGNFVRLDNGGGISTGYGHMSRIAVSSGQQVQRGQVIGYVGSTGLSTGPHVHFEVRRNGRPIDPESVSFVVRRAAPDAAKMPAVKARLEQLLNVEPGAALAPLK